MKKKQQIKTLILVGSNGFIRRQKHNPKEELPTVINIPFIYQIKLTDPTIGLDDIFPATAYGEFFLQRKTRTTAFYRLGKFDFIKTK